MSGTHHVFLTRFNLPSPGVESLIRSDDAWLRERVRLFESYTLPAVLAQTRSDHTWLIYLDPLSPEWLKARMHLLEQSHVATPRYAVSDHPADVARDIDDILDSNVDRVITSNLDNDDGLARDFVERLYAVATPREREAVYFARGLVRCDENLYLHTDRRNAFVAVAEPREAMVTCWVDWHNRVGRHMPVHMVEGAPAWLQVVHGRNVSNRVRGRLVSPGAYRDLFGPGTAGTREPSSPQRVVSRLIAAPARAVRDTGRQAAARALLRAGGKDAVERWKLRLHGRSRRREA
ncbi:MAG: glycosyltransferase [Dermatophilaceae bacterium]